MRNVLRGQGKIRVLDEIFYIYGYFSFLQSSPVFGMNKLSAIRLREIGKLLISLKNKNLIVVRVCPLIVHI